MPEAPLDHNSFAVLTVLLLPWSQAGVKLVPSPEDTGQFIFFLTVFFSTVRFC